MNELQSLDEIINELNDELGRIGNNLIEKQIELDYLKENFQMLNQKYENIIAINENLYKIINKNQNLKKMKFL
jgi:hypothetical protein